MNIDLETPTDVLIKSENEQDALRIRRIATVLNHSRNSLDWFKLAADHKDFPSEAKPLVKVGKWEEAFYRFSYVCSGGCIKYHPLILALNYDDILVIKYLLRNTNVLLRHCICHNESKIVGLMHDLSKQTLLKLAEIRPSFKDLVEQVLRWQIRRLELEFIKRASLEFTVTKYYMSGLDSDLSKVISALYELKNNFNKEHMFILQRKPNRTIDEILWKSQFEKLLANMALFQVELMIKAGHIHNDNLNSFVPYMNQKQKNFRSWDIFSRGWKRIALKELNETLALGGDLYTADLHGNPWIVCLLARSCWVDYDDVHSSNEKGPRLCLAIGDTFVTQPAVGFYHRAKSHDRWRIESHSKRSLKFRRLTKALLCSIKNVTGRLLPKPAIVKLMEYVARNYYLDNINVTEPDELDQSYRLILSALYLETYDEKIDRIGIIRGLPFKSNDMYVTAELLGSQLFDYLKKNGNLLEFLRALETKSNAIMDLYRNAKSIKKELESKSLKTCQDYDFMNIPVYPPLRLAFHDTISWINLRQVAAEPPLKKLKVLPYVKTPGE